MMYKKIIFKFVNFERSYNVSKLAKIPHLILAMFVSQVSVCEKVDLRNALARASLVTVATAH